MIRNGEETDVQRDAGGHARIGAEPVSGLRYNEDPFCWLRGSRRTGTASSTG